MAQTQNKGWNEINWQLIIQEHNAQHNTLKGLESVVKLYSSLTFSTMVMGSMKDRVTLWAEGSIKYSTDTNRTAAKLDTFSHVYFCRNLFALY
jgi:hypothetical protein